MELVIAGNTITGVTLTEEFSLTTSPKIATTVKRKEGLPHDGKTVGFS